MDTNKPIQRGKIVQWHSVFVLTSTYIIMLFYVGLSFSFGTIFTDIMASFSSTRAETAVIQTAFVSVFMISGVFAGIIIKKFGYVRVGLCGSVLFSISLMTCFFASSLIFLIICVGVFNGIGLSCVFICSTNVISHQFSGKKQLLYMSVHLTSSGIGGTIYPYLLSYLRDLYGWKGALLLTGAICLNAVPCCILWKQSLYSKEDFILEHNAAQIAEFQSRMQVKTNVSGETISIEKTDQTDTQVSDLIFVIQYPVLKGKTTIKTITVNGYDNKPSHACYINSIIGMNIKSILCNRCFMLVIFGTILSYPSLNTILTFIGDIYYDNGLTNDDVSFGLFILNIFSIFGRLLLGIVLHSKSVPALLIPMLCSLASAVLFLLFPFVKIRSVLLALSAVSGVPIGMFSSMFAVVTLKLVNSNLYPIAVGIFYTLTGISILVFGPLYGFLRDVTGSYTASFYTGTTFHLVAAFVFFLAYMFRRNQKYEIRRQSAVFYLTNF